VTNHALGWNSFFENHFAEYAEKGYSAGRVSSQFQRFYHVHVNPQQELLAEVSGKFRHEARYPANFPAVGDWVVLKIAAQENKATIHAVLPRKTKFSRKMAGEDPKEQIICANVDGVFLVQALDSNYNLPRLERYLALVNENNIRPLIVLHKSDLDPNCAEKKIEIETRIPNVPVLLSHKADAHGLDQIRAHLLPKHTYAFLGSSGVGKSTLVNMLSGNNLQNTAEVRASDHKGRHTTTNRELIFLEQGALLIDTPGMRELQLWEAQSGVENTFEDITELATQCRFRDCKHTQEPGCAIKAALANGTIESARFLNYQKMLNEQALTTAKSKESRDKKNQNLNPSKNRKGF
jgi:ribosome biogenesis GTPase